MVVYLFCKKSKMEWEFGKEAVSTGVSCAIIYKKCVDM